MRLRANPEYVRRHLFAAAVLLGLGGWFGYDGLVTYPRTDAADLYRSIEKSDPPKEMPREALEAFKRQKTQTQYSFAALGLLAGLVVGLRLLKSIRFDFVYDADGFVFGGRRFAWSQVKVVDRSRWKGKGLLGVTADDAGRPRRFTLDAWHHVGVTEFEAMVGCRESSVIQDAVLT